ncbi:unnamed protein product [Clonostachys rosea]|uniref:Uncharacterized protein n=1 Tax=Bionectria ochroleuca TaxID=29856 RepID=A0ABY6U316_BIOOC|nr:unnamed protein product [Clonostachys rosea]
MWLIGQFAMANDNVGTSEGTTTNTLQVHPSYRRNRSVDEDEWSRAEEYTKYLNQFKHWHSFASHLFNYGFDGVGYGVSGIEMALEEPPCQMLLMDYRVWIATEWLLNCGSRVFQEMKNKDHNPSALTGRRDGGDARSLPRWEFWKKRLDEISSSDSLGLTDETKKRVIDTLKAMEDA